MFFVVQVTHSHGGHGPVTEPVTVALNPAVALTVAHSVEEKGFRFTNQEDGVQVFRLQEGELRSREQLMDNSGRPAPHSLVYYRLRDRHAPGGWRIAWLDSELEQYYRKIFDSITMPA